MYKGKINEYFPNMKKKLCEEINGCNTLLDLGCGPNSPIKDCNIPFSVGVDLFENYLNISKENKIHNEYIQADIRKIDFKPKSFDIVLCSEVLEHLTKEEGHDLLKKMERWAKFKIIITTPNGYVFQNQYDDNYLQEHRSGWTVNQLINKGFKVYGMMGWKKLRGNQGLVKYKPQKFWILISSITQKITFNFPSQAFQLFAVKDLVKNEFNY